ncbi:hypothetical protein K469DRAFT_391682 [Zopfia rhizophila CBS 207.26]|uniref:Uncharacterized protein n=1 Tax=Zopfia rhizophila CBS 207.26 TaxID=1314779 RepID=A0A6A6EJ71_9PEZI|nr:hypothetical protein K469DRAFT_391682 [Zopfia rhizophila CBS 207.26]
MFFQFPPLLQATAIWLLHDLTTFIWYLRLLCLAEYFLFSLSRISVILRKWSFLSRLVHNQFRFHLSSYAKTASGTLTSTRLDNQKHHGIAHGSSKHLRNSIYPAINFPGITSFTCPNKLGLLDV